jgi:hypothetical protein
VTYVTATTDDLVTLNRDHGQAVQELRLAHIRLLKPIGGRIGWSVPGWRRVFAELAGIENLETASIRQWIRPMFIDKRTWPVYTAQRKVEVATKLTKYLAYDGKATIDRGMQRDGESLMPTMESYGDTGALATTAKIVYIHDESIVSIPKHLE